ncbi:hypothetical protein [Halorussus lipolyticus]|uniref:hypothetical protein n=1 Tax=Halorussus lipolyticus TaxID=3034024 RepID=UPI0023E7DCD8|nr:hypothetical protein [Halorussus sp. DT80]
MSTSKEVNFDTSVLLNYVYAKLPGEIEEDKGSERLIENSDIYKVIGGKVSGEFERCCERRNKIYDDLLDWLEENPDLDIYDYDISQRDIQSSPNDTSHIRYDVQCGWGHEERRKQLSDFRRLSQNIETLQREIIESLIDKSYPESSNSKLKKELGDLDIDHDKDVIVDAVEIHKKDSIGILVAIDSDIVYNSDRINNRIQSIEGSKLKLQIMKADDV